jgi:predicted glycosyltransferase
MPHRRDHKRVLIYSHDSFGLGHLRRCRAIAHSLVEADSAVSVLILSGSPIIGSFDFRSRVDFVRIPGVIKLRNGEYVSLSLHIDIEETLAMRSSIIHHTADIFDPDLLIVDKEPLGLRGEVRPTLDLLRERGTPLILGLRDVMDDPSALESEWERKNAVPALSEYYDELWVYGLPQICDPLEGIDLPASVRRRMIYTGYLRRRVGEAAAATATS